MNRKEIRERLLESERPKKPTTYWVPVDLLLPDLSEGHQEQFLDMVETEYNDGCPLRIDVPKYVPGIPDKSKEYTKQVLAIFPKATFSESGSGLYSGKVWENPSVQLTVEFRTYSTTVKMFLHNKMRSVDAFGGGDSVQEALTELKGAVLQNLQDAQVMRDYLEDK